METVAWLGLLASLGLSPASGGPGLRASPPPSLTLQIVEAQADDGEADAAIASALAERQRLRPWHIVFGNLTWAATNAATLLGFLHFHDRYGWDGSITGPACASGNPILGNDLCGGVPWPHVVATTALTVFYGATFTLALFMPDPLDVGEGRGDFATRITAHRALRWVTLGLMAAQIVLGAIVSNAGINDFDTRRALAATHLALGTITWGTVTAMGILGSLLAW